MGRHLTRAYHEILLRARSVSWNQHIVGTRSSRNADSPSASFARDRTSIEGQFFGREFSP
jgi:hypothetical protein